MLKWCAFIVTTFLLASCVSAPERLTTTFPSLPSSTQISIIATTQSQSLPTLPLATTEMPTTPPVVAPTDSGTEIPHRTQALLTSLDSIKMFDQQYGWSTASQALQDAHILRTIDGGQSWQDVTPPEPASTPQGDGKRVLPFFLNSQEAWVTYYPSNQAASSPALIWRTQDGGATWQSSLPLIPGEIEASFTPNQLFFINSQQGWLLLAHGAAAGSQPVTLYQTQDGGLTWLRVLDMLSSGSLDINTCCQSGMIFTDSLNGLITTNLGPDTRAHVNWTRDGGKYWLRQELPLTEQSLSSAICGTLSPVSPAPGRIYLIMECEDPDHSISQPLNYLYTTSDFGEHWNIISLPEPGIESGVWNNNRRDRRIEFLDPQAGWLFVTEFNESSDGSSPKKYTHLYQTNNSGKDWRFVSKLDWAGSFSFVDAKLGWAIARDNLNKSAVVNTSDGGSNWKIIEPTVKP